MNTLRKNWRNNLCAGITALIVILSGSCKNKSAQNPDKPATLRDTIIVHDTINYEDAYDWQQGFGLTHDPEVDSVWFKPVKFYINNPECSGLAIDFYYGHLRPSDDRITDELLKLAVTNNKDLRPFYRWCLNKTVQISDGALSEVIGEPIRRYAEKYPAELMVYLSEDTSAKRYYSWASEIGYSGFYEGEDYQNTTLIRNKMFSTMKANCTGCDSKTLQWLEKFSKDCFH